MGIKIKRKNPLIEIIQKALEAWIKSRCDTCLRIEVNLNSTPFQLVKGQIEGMRLIAEGINLQDVHIDYAEIFSSAINFKVDLRQNKSIINLNKKFEIKAKLTLTSEGLENTLISRKWHWVKNLLASHLLQNRMVDRIYIKNNKLGIKGSDKNEKSDEILLFDLTSKSGKIIIDNRNQSFILPMDESIYIDKAILDDGKLLINLSAKVTP